MFKIQNNWTKKRMIAKIFEKNNGTMAVSKSGFCVYKNADNNHCAVGAFFPENLERLWSFQGDVSEVLAEAEECSLSHHFEEVFPLTEGGLAEMQNIHDLATNSVNHKIVKYGEYLKINDIRERLELWINNNVEEVQHVNN